MIESTRTLELTFSEHTLCDETNEIIADFFETPTGGVSDATVLTGSKLKEHFEEVNSKPSRPNPFISPKHITPWTKFQVDGYSETILAIEKTPRELEGEWRESLECDLCAEYQECHSCGNPARISPQRLVSAIEMHRYLTTTNHKRGKELVLGYLRPMNAFVIMETWASTAK